MRDSFSLIVPSAGLGTRMNKKVPKSLISHEGISVLEHILSKYRTYAINVVLVLRNNLYVQEFEEIFKKLNFEYYIALQESAKGSFFAINNAINQFEDKITPNFYVNWGDHPTIKENVVADMRDALAKHPQSSLVLPLVEKLNPYVSYILKNKKVVDVIESKTTDFSIKKGLNDCGSFLVNKSIFQSINSTIKENLYDEFRELNFIKTIPDFEKYNSGIKKIIYEDTTMTQGLNTEEELLNWINSK